MNKPPRTSTFSNRLRVGLVLAVANIRRASPWTTGLIVFIMILTFLNLNVVSGILVGLIEGAEVAVRSGYTSDVLVSPLKEKSYIEGSQSIVSFAEALPWVVAVTPRYVEGGSVEVHYKEKVDPDELPESVGTLFAGINPKKEEAVTGLSRFIVEGAYLEPDDYDKVILGSSLLRKYLPIDSPGFATLEDVEIGSKIKIVVNGNEREVIVKGITKSKVDEIDRRVFFVDSQLRELIGRGDRNVDEIAIKTLPGQEVLVAEALRQSGFSKSAKIQTWQEGQPKFLTDIKKTFALLGNMISSIGLAVASITVFIVVFINAITRRKYIGILKGIGIESRSIATAYILQSLVYAAVGIAVGSLVLFGLLKPFFAAHPINFPFSDGILVATAAGTTIRAALLLGATFVAGLLPAWIVVRQNTLDAILGR